VKEKIAKARRQLEAASSVVVTTHKRPDGDAISSMLAVYLGIGNNDIEIVPVLFDKVPERFQFLPGASAIRHSIQSPYDMLIAVDCADYDRIGFPIEGEPPQIDLNIDHHPTNTNFAQINLVDPQAASATQLLYELMPQLGLALTTDVRTNLLTGLLTDTIGFRTESVTPASLRITADLLESGSELDDLYHFVLTRKDFLEIKYWGKGISRLKKEDGLIWTYLSVSDRTEVGYPGNDDADLVDLMMTIEGIRIAIIFIEQDPTCVKVSFRSRGGVDVAELAARFEGGGHKPAAGALIAGDLPTVMDQVLSAAKASLSPESMGSGG
jgi:phosphoesterase RecJ-like protein